MSNHNQNIRMVRDRVRPAPATNDTAAPPAPVPDIIATGNDCRDLLASHPAFAGLYRRSWTNRGFRITQGQWTGPTDPCCWIPERATKDEATRRLLGLLARIEQKRVRVQRHRAEAVAAEAQRQEAQRVRQQALEAETAAAVLEWAGDVREAAGHPRTGDLPEDLRFTRLGSENVKRARCGNTIPVELPVLRKERARFLVRLEAFLKADRDNG
jgi:hypothetical protein